MTSFSPTQPFVGTQRNELRKLARNHPDFDRWRAINDPKNEMKKGEIIKAINDLGLVAQAEAILGAPQTAIVGVIGEDGVYDIESDDETGAGDGGAPPSLTEGQGAGLDDDQVSPVEKDVELVLGAVRPFLAPSIVANIETALRPIVVAAHKPAQTIIVQPSVPLKDGEAPHARRIGVSTMAKVFMVGGAKGKRRVALWNDPLAPKPDAGYVMDGARMYLGASSLRSGRDRLVRRAGRRGQNHDGERICGVHRDGVSCGSVSITQPR